MKTTRDLCLMAVFTALLTGGKYALSFIPNVEIVTSLLIVFTLAAGLRRSLLPCLCFILIDCFLYGFGTWVPMYLGYWPLLCIFVALTHKLKMRWRIIVSIAIGIVMTVYFSVWTTFVEICLLGGIGSGYFWQMFAARYMSGSAFFITHIVSNCIVLPLLVPLLTRLLHMLLQKTEPRRMPLAKNTGAPASKTYDSPAHEMQK